MFRSVLFAVLILFTFNNANALSNESLYKLCKPYADRAFDLKTEEDLLCIYYTSGVLDSSENLCFVMSGAAKEDTSIAFARGFFGTSNAHEKKDSIIQAYVNKMKNSPEKWEFVASDALREVSRQIAPCE